MKRTYARGTHVYKKYTGLKKILNRTCLRLSWVFCGLSAGLYDYQRGRPLMYRKLTEANFRCI